MIHLLARMEELAQMTETRIHVNVQKISVETIAKVLLKVNYILGLPNVHQADATSTFLRN